MKNKIWIILFFIIGVSIFFQFTTKSENDYITFSVNPSKSKLSFYWKNNNHEIFGSIDKLRKWLSKNNNELIFATNAGMYKKDQSPQGLFIENGIQKTPIDTLNAKGNFYLKPNGIFYLNNSNKAFICKTEDLHNDKSIKFATQSGPMLVIDGQIHSAFNEKSTNLNIRNGVGILPNNEVLFAMSKKDINFYEFANFFKSKGCKNALYLDGFVSRTYCPKENWEQIDGNFGVIIAVTKN